MQETAYLLRTLNRLFAGDTGAPTPAGLRAAGRMSVPKIIEVYHKAHVARMTEALGETYDVIWSFLGDEDFFALCADYIKDNPSNSYSLSDYGQNFSAFISTHACSKRAAFLPELAQLGWEFKNLFHQNNPPTCEIPASLLESQRDFGLELNPAKRLLKSVYPLFDIWQAIRSGRPLSSHNENLPLARPQCLLMRKEDDQVYLHAISSLTYDLIEKIDAGKTVLSSLEELAREHPTLEPSAIQDAFGVIAKLCIRIEL